LGSGKKRSGEFRERGKGFHEKQKKTKKKIKKGHPPDEGERK